MFLQTFILTPYGSEVPMILYFKGQFAMDTTVVWMTPRVCKWAHGYFDQISLVDGEVDAAIEDIAKAAERTQPRRSLVGSGEE